MRPATFVPSFHAGRLHHSTAHTHDAQICRRRLTPTAQATAAGRAPQNPSQPFSNANANVNTPKTDPTHGHANPEPPDGPTWQKEAGCDVYIPSETPSGVIFFIGGLGAGVSAATFYSHLLTRVSKGSNVAIIAYRLPIIPTTEHGALASTAATALAAARAQLPALAGLPAFGVGHSLGTKLLLLACVDPTAREQLSLTANVLLSFNNSQLQQALPLLRDPARTTPIRAALRNATAFLSRLDTSATPPQLHDLKTGAETLLRNAEATMEPTRDFTPTAAETYALAATRYNVSRNLVVGFTDDSLDDGEELVQILRSRFGQRGVVMWRQLPGTHVTPVAPDFSAGQFDSVGNADWDQAIREAGLNVSEEIEGAITVVVAFLRLQLELSAKA